MAFNASLADEDYCYLTTTGRVTGRARTIEIWFGAGPERDVQAIYMLSGGRDRSDWVKNLMREPAVRLRIADSVFDGRARVVSDADEDALARRLLFDKYSERYGGDLSDWRQNALPIAVDLEAEEGR
jgi:deazaflavin-dependent oxidoreductase (nitroreductase family)